MDAARAGVGLEQGGLRPLDADGLGDHLDRLYRAAWGFCGSREDAEDLVQETYVRVLARPRFIRRDDDVGYLLRVLRNTFLTSLRTRGRRPACSPLADDFERVEQGDADQPAAALASREVFAAVSLLSPGFREVVVAVDLVGLSYEEAAIALRLRLGTVKSRLHRARAELVSYLDLQAV